MNWIPIKDLDVAEEISTMLENCGLETRIDTKRKRGKIKGISISIIGKKRDWGDKDACISVPERAVDIKNELGVVPESNQ